MTPDEWLEGVRARLAAATPGPWKQSYRSYEEEYSIRSGSKHIGSVTDWREEGAANIDLLVNSRADLERAVAEIERLRSIVEELEKENYSLRAIRDLKGEGCL